MLSSAGNAALLFAVARSSDTETFGRFALGYAFVAFALAMTRAVLGVPLTADLPGVVPARRATAVGHALTIALATGVVTALVLLVLGVLGPAGGRGALLLLAVATPVALAQDVLRFVASASARLMYAVVSDGVWFVSAVGAFVLAHARSEPALAVLVWLLGGAVALVVLWWGTGRVRPIVRGAGDMLRGEVRRRHLAFDALASAASGLIALNLIALAAGVAVVGAVRAATTLFGPLSTFYTFLTFGLGPEIARAAATRARVLTAAAAAAATVLAVCWGVFFAVDPWSVGEFLLGPSWAGAEGLLLGMTLQAVGLGIWAAYAVQLRVTGRTAAALRLRLTYSGAFVVALGLCAAVAGTASAIVSAMAVLALLLAAASVVVTVVETRGPTTGVARRTSGSRRATTDQTSRNDARS